MSKVKDIIEAYELGWTNGIRSSNQSACPAAGCRQDCGSSETPQCTVCGLDYEAEREIDLDGNVCGWSAQCDCELSEVARRPADSEGVLDRVFKAIDTTIEGCEVRLKQMEDDDPGRIRIVHRMQDLRTIRECLDDIQNQSSEPGLG